MKKYLKFIIVIVLSFMLSFPGSFILAEGSNDASVADAFSLCDAETNPQIMAAFKFGGIILLIVKILVPIILIVLGMIDMGKAVVDDKDDAIKKNAIIFAKRIGAGILVFIAPSLLLIIFDSIDAIDNVNSAFKNCVDCLLDTSKCPDNISLIKK